MKKIVLSLLAVVFLSGTVYAQTHSEQFIRNWEFSRDGNTWEQVCVPHDWAISGPFDKKWDLQVVAIEQNGETEKSEKSGRSGALPWIGEGHYRTTLSFDALPGHAELVFDGAMSEPVVSVNDHEAGRWAYGYNAFRVDVTPYLNIGENEIRVDLKNVEESSRWYPGGGLYRPVKLVTTPQKAHIDEWGITTKTELHVKQIKDRDYTKFVVEVPIVNTGKGLPVIMELTDPNGKDKVWISPAPMSKGTCTAIGTFMIPDAKLWTPETPYMYKLKITLCDGKSAPNVYDDFGKAIDELTINVGLRTVNVSKEGGFQLNGVTRKLKGVCLHHDLGPLGAAVNKAALIRQIKILKNMGCDAIRTAHNMPSQMQMDVCDSLGMMVMAESFDMWVYPKCKNGYARFFKEWADKDITNLVMAHRRHPSIVMWSIGNEIPEQGMEGGRKMASHLQDLCHQLDPTRPVTQGCDRPDNAVSTGFLPTMDVPGLNYRLHRYQDTYQKLWHGFLLGSETASTVSSRGVYKFPVEFSNHKTYEDGQCNGYDSECCWWSNLPDDDFMAMDDLPYTIGQFVWTGFDYLGEPTPYDGYWPSRSSYFGICDLAGLPKDRYYLYRSVWNRNEHTLHLLPHWTWPGREGEVTPVYCYTDYPTAELFVNGKSQGKITKVGSNQVNFNTIDTQHPAANPERYDRYRLRWNNVRYQPGELCVVAYDAEGREAARQTIRTAGKGSALKLQADRTELQADGDDLAYITVSIVDRHGTELPTATDLLTFEVKGAGQFRGVCNGDATSLEPFTQPQMHLFSGKLVVTVQAGQTPGPLTLLVSDRNNRRLRGQITINVR